ncbi:hypothetical protein C8Q79DRAFT_581702 [Trametes meyenii]|nr:hypothetical protein C8Q79DRAFT_581702 [Trametes meyenii]
MVSPVVVGSSVAIDIVRRAACLADLVFADTSPSPPPFILSSDLADTSPPSLLYYPIRTPLSLRIRPSTHPSAVLASTRFGLGSGLGLTRSSFLFFFFFCVFLFVLRFPGVVGFQLLAPPRYTTDAFESLTRPRLDMLLLYPMSSIRYPVSIPSRL